MFQDHLDRFGPNVKFEETLSLNDLLSYVQTRDEWKFNRKIGHAWLLILVFALKSRSRPVRNFVKERKVLEKKKQTHRCCQSFFFKIIHRYTSFFQTI